MIAPQKNYQVKKKPRKSSKLGICAICLVAILAMSALVILFPKNNVEEPEKNVEKKTTTISEVAPAKVRQAVEEPAKPKTYKEMTRDEKLQSIRDKYGDNIPENLKPTVYYLENPPQRTFHPAKSKFNYFKRRSEREIASVLNIEPGTWMMRPVQFGDKFDKDLTAAFEETIEFKKDDSDEVRAMKQAVIDTKKELAERIKKGEVASEIMNSTISELYTLGQYKRDLEEQVGAIRRNAEYTDQDVEDVVNAANQMLEAKGLPPMRMPNMLIRRASLRKAADRAAAKASENN